MTLNSLTQVNFFMLPLSDTLLLLLDEHFDDLALWAASLSQQCPFILKEHTWVSASSNQSSSLSLSSSPNNWLYSWCASNNIMKRSLNCFISSSTAITFLLENSKSSMVLYFLINLPLIFLLLSLRVSFLYAKPFSVRFLDVVALPPLPCGMTSFLALYSTHCEHELSPGTLVSLILVQFSQCWSSLTIIGWHLAIPFGFLLSVPGSPRSVSNLSLSDILPTRLTTFSSTIYYFCATAQ